MKERKVLNELHQVTRRAELENQMLYNPKKEKPVEFFRNTYGNGHKTIYILGSGASMNWFPKEFFSPFAGHITIGVNRIIEWVHCKFCIVHHHEIIPEIQQYRKNYQVLFVSRYWRCEIKGEAPDHSNKDYFVYDHCDQGFSQTDFRPLDPEFQRTHPNHILTGGNTVINAIGLAVYMGAKNIVLVGCDGGAINDKTNLDGYHPQNLDEKLKQHGHSVRSLALNMQVRDRLRQIGVNLVSLSPFLDLDCEGNIFHNQRPENDDPKFIELYEKYRLK